MQPSLVQRLRDSVTQCRALDRSQLLEEAAAEIERLRQQSNQTGGDFRSVTLTDAEREAIHWVVGDVADITGPVEDTLRGLLERLK